MYISPYSIANPSFEILITDNNANNLYLNSSKLEATYALYGDSLISLLQNESYLILNAQGSLDLNRILTGNPNADATRLIGSLAEVLVVEFCKKYPEINSRLMMYASESSRLYGYFNDYVAVATGSQQAKLNHHIHYNPNDTQRDIIWVDKEKIEHQLLCFNSSKRAGKPAGIQVKASHDYQYVLKSIKDYHYPVLYFDLNNDWWRLSESLQKDNELYSLKKIIPHDEITNEIKKTLNYYFDIIEKVFLDEISIDELIEISKYEGYTEILKSLELSQISQNKKIILPSK